MKKVAILIPTFKRRGFLEKNCLKLLKVIENNHLTNLVEIVISDNHSEDSTVELLDSLQTTCTEKEISLTVYHQPQNIGSVRNVLFLIHQSTAEFALFLGDDDFLDESYLPEVVRELVSNDQLSCIVPSIAGVTEEGMPSGFGRDRDLPSRLYQKGFGSCLENAWRGHQLSGLVFRRADISEALECYQVDNLYLFIFIVGLSACQGQLLHLTTYPVLVTSPPQSKKAWSYGEDALIKEIFDNFKRLPDLGAINRSRLELKILDEQYWRYMMYLKKGPKMFIKALSKINFGPNTSTLTSFLFPFLIIFFLIKRVLILIAQGELKKTLTRPVDI